MDMTVRMSAMTMTVQDSTNMGLVKAPAAVVNVSESLRRNSTMAMIWNTVLALPYQLAAMTVPLLACHHADARDDELAGKDDEHGPAGQHGQLHQGDERRRDEDLISQRIHELPEVGHFPAAAGEISVDPIGAGDENEDTGGDDALRLHGDARQAHPFGQGLRIASTKTGTRQMRMSVTIFAGVQSLSEPWAGWWSWPTRLPFRKAGYPAMVQGTNAPISPRDT